MPKHKLPLGGGGRKLPKRCRTFGCSNKLSTPSFKFIPRPVWDGHDKPAAFRLAMRRRKSKPLIKLLRKIIVQAKGSLHPTHDLMKAIGYTFKHWRALTRFLKNPDIAIDNNEAERAIKCWVLVRRNSLFVSDCRPPFGHNF
ncbi:transposase [bacterium]|nr:transposase [bacterium]MBP9810010.1 transposase [bacterium]